LIKRILSTVALWSIIAVTLWFFRTSGALVLIAIISALTLREFFGLMRGAGYAPFTIFGSSFGVLITLNLKLQADEAGGETGVLTTASDGLGKLILTDGEAGSLFVRCELDAQHLDGLECFFDELDWVGVPADSWQRPCG
jgi:hypothetical protein